MTDPVVPNRAQPAGTGDRVGAIGTSGDQSEGLSLFETCVLRDRHPDVEGSAVRGGRIGPCGPADAIQRILKLRERPRIGSQGRIARPRSCRGEAKAQGCTGWGRQGKHSPELGALVDHDIIDLDGPVVIQCRRRRIRILGQVGRAPVISRAVVIDDPIAADGRPGRAPSVNGFQSETLGSLIRCVIANGDPDQEPVGRVDLRDFHRRVVIDPVGAIEPLDLSGVGPNRGVGQVGIVVVGELQLVDIGE